MTAISDHAVPGGFRAGFASAGLKGPGKPDVAVFLAERAVPVAAVFTRNDVVSHSVSVSRNNLGKSGGYGRAVLVNSGNANACLGKEGEQRTLKMAAELAAALGIPEEQVLLASTGLIGFSFSHRAVARAALEAAKTAAPSGEAFEGAARAILTTDTRPKVAFFNSGFKVLGLAKGAAMLSPSLATMLAFLFTDAACGPAELKEILLEAASQSFGAIDFDGATSTNDTVYALSSGEAGPVENKRLVQGFLEVCDSLARQMVADAEGSSKSIEVRVRGARSLEQARAAALAVAGSLLVKCSIHGADPYWGRIVSELGAARVGVDPYLLTVGYGEHVVFKDGGPVAFDYESVVAYLRGRHVVINCDLGQGAAEFVALSAEITGRYIELNSETY